MPVKKEKVDHEYIDFSGVMETDLPPRSEDDRISAEQNFPSKLHYMLSESERDNQTHIIGWQVHGRAFAVHDAKAFAEQMLPLYVRLASSAMAVIHSDRRPRRSLTISPLQVLPPDKGHFLSASA